MVIFQSYYPETKVNIGQKLIKLIKTTIQIDENFTVKEQILVGKLENLLIKIEEEKNCKFNTMLMNSFSVKIFFNFVKFYNI